MEQCLEELENVVGKLRDLLKESLVELFSVKAFPLYEKLVTKKDLERGECTSCYVQTVGQSVWNNLDKRTLQAAWAAVLNVTPSVSKSINWLALKAETWEQTETLEFQMNVIHHVVDKLRAQVKEENQ